MSVNPVTGRYESQNVETGVGPVVDSGVKNTCVAAYAFARYGGAISSIFLATNSIPAGAVITNAYLDVTTVPVGPGASIAVTVEGAGDIQAAAAISGAPWSTTGRKTGLVEPGTESGYLKTTVPRFVKVTISGAALTAGKFTVVLEYDLV